jgi:hypothetical protein
MSTPLIRGSRLCALPAFSASMGRAIQQLVGPQTVKLSLPTTVDLKLLAFDSGGNTTNTSCIYSHGPRTCMKDGTHGMEGYESSSGGGNETVDIV